MYVKAFSVVGCFITYIAWVHIYTPGGSAIELPLFIVHHKKPGHRTFFPRGP